MNNFKFFLVFLLFNGFILSAQEKHAKSMETESNELSNKNGVAPAVNIDKFEYLMFGIGVVGVFFYFRRIKT